jgi:hypothetical protein
MKLLQLPPSELRQQLAGAGVWLRTGPFSLKLQSRIPCVAEGLDRLYGQFEVRNPHEAFADFHVSINPPSKLRRWLRPQVEFSYDGVQPFKPLPLNEAFPMLESGLNWCISTQAHHYRSGGNSAWPASLWKKHVNSRAGARWLAAAV